MEEELDEIIKHIELQLHKYLNDDGKSNGIKRRLT